MDNIKLTTLKRKLDKAEELKQTIKNFDRILDTIKNGSCEEISYEYYGKDPTGGFGSEPGEWCTLTQKITSETLGVSKEKYEEWFSSQLKVYIGKLREDVQKEFDEFEIEGE